MIAAILGVAGPLLQQVVALVSAAVSGSPSQHAQILAALQAAREALDLTANQCDATMDARVAATATELGVK